MNATMTQWTNVLTARAACCAAVAFARKHESFQSAWDACERGDWMLWWLGRTIAAPKESDERKRLVRIACACARLALPHVKAGELRPLRAIETAERWANSDPSVTLEDVRTAAADAYDAYAAYADAYAADAAYAAYAAYAAATAAATAAAAAAAAAVYVVVWLNIQRQCAAIVRAEYPMPPTGETR